jgi:hypothetical protein
MAKKRKYSKSVGRDVKNEMHRYGQGSPRAAGAETAAR